MIIRKKADIEELLATFHLTMPFEGSGKKHFLLFKDEKRGGEWALIRYADGLFTLHGKGKGYCDRGESVMKRTSLHAFIWTHRKVINETLKTSLASLK